MSKKDITADRVRELLNYDPETGLLTWRVNRSKAKAGSVAGIKYKHRIDVGIDGGLYRAHRIIWLFVYGKWPDKTIDHIDGDPHNNRLQNLRDVSNIVNCQNKHRAPISNKSSGLLGVSRNGNKWQAGITVAKKTIHLGRHATAEKAHDAYVHAKRILHEGNML